jgi:integrase
LGDFRFHDLRHCFAQDLEDAGVGHLITPALHHSSASLRPRYAKARTAMLADAINAVQRKRA